MSIVIKRKPLTLMEKLYLPEIARGLSTTFRKLWEKPVTLEYPEQRPTIPEGYRGVPTLVKDPEGREKCVSCQLCEFVCPPKAIRITPGSIPEDSDHAHVEKAPQEFDIDMLRCIYCGMCQEVCPEEAIWLQEPSFPCPATHGKRWSITRRSCTSSGARSQTSTSSGGRKRKPRKEGAGTTESQPAANNGDKHDGRFLFFIFSTAALAAGIGVVLSRNTVNGAMFLIGTFLSMAAMFVLLEAYFSWLSSRCWSTRAR